MENIYFNNNGKQQVVFEKMISAYQKGCVDENIKNFQRLYSLYFDFHTNNFTIKNNESCKKIFEELQQECKNISWYFNELNKSKDDSSYSSILEHTLDIFLIKMEGKY